MREWKCWQLHHLKYWIDQELSYLRQRETVFCLLHCLFKHNTEQCGRSSLQPCINSSNIATLNKKQVMASYLGQRKGDYLTHRRMWTATQFWRNRCCVFTEALVRITNRRKDACSCCTLIRLCSELMSGLSLLLLSRCLRTKHKCTFISERDFVASSFLLRWH